MSRTQKSAWNLSSGFFFTVVTVAVGLVSTPLLLRWLGPEVFGSYRVMLDMGGYLYLLELGMSGALYARLALALGQKETALVEKLLAAGFRFYLKVGIVALSVGSFLALVLPSLFRTETIGVMELRIAWVIYLSATFLLPFSVYRVLIEAQQRTYLISIMLTFQSLLTTALLLVTAYRGFGLPGQTAAVVLSQIPFNIALFWLGSRKFRIKPTARTDKEVRQSLQKLNLPSFAYSSSYRFGTLGDTVFVGLILGPAIAAAFFLTQRLVSLAQGQLLNIGNSTWAGLAELYAQGKLEVFRDRLMDLTGFVSGLSLTVLLPIVAYNRHFITHWVGVSNFGGDFLSVLFCVNAWLLAVFYLWGWTLNGTGNIAHWTRYALTFILINITFGVAGTFLFGLIGPPLGTLMAGLLVTSWAMPRTLKRLFGFSPVALWKETLSPLRWAVPYAIVLWFLSRTHTPTGWPTLIAEMALAVLGALFIWWIIGMSGEDRHFWRARLQGTLGR